MWLPIMDVTTVWDSTLELLKWALTLQELTPKWHTNPKCKDYRLLFTMQDKWTVIKYIIEVLRAFQYWTLWVSKWHMVTLHCFITVHDDMSEHMDGTMWVVAKKNIQWKEDLYFAVKCAWQKLFKSYAEVTPMTGMLLISEPIHDCFWILREFSKWGKGMDINPDDKTSYTTYY